MSNADKTAARVERGTFGRGCDRSGVNAIAAFSSVRQERNREGPRFYRPSLTA